MESNEEQVRANILKALWSQKDRRKAEKSVAFKQFRRGWQGWNTVSRIGSLMEATRKLNHSYNYDQWVQLYFTECKSATEVREQVLQMAKAMKLDPVDALNFWWISVIDFAYWGKRNELQVVHECRRKLRKLNRGILLRESTPEEDTRFGLDYVGTDKDGRTLFGIQVKGERYFTSKNPDTVKSREEIHPEQYAKFYKETGCRVWYVVIEEVLRQPDWQLKPAHHAGIDNKVA